MKIGKARVAVLYPNNTGKAFDMNYYKNKHMPLVTSKLAPFGLLSTSIDKANSDNEPFTAIGYLLFDSLENCQKGLASVGAELADDVKNYTDIEPMIQISEVI
jgi:uncharacterized protein (TIGR02118 family)